MPGDASPNEERRPRDSASCPDCGTRYTQPRLEDALPATTRLRRDGDRRRGGALTVIDCPDCETTAELAVGLEIVDGASEPEIEIDVAPIDEFGGTE